MWENYKSILVGRDHKIVFPRINDQGMMKPIAGKAWLVPLFYKKDLLLGEGDALYAWTVCVEDSPKNWLINHEDSPSLRYEVVIKTHTETPLGHYLIIPKDVREKGWLPKAGGTVVCEFGPDEINIWTQSAYNIETVREARE